MSWVVRVQDDEGYYIFVERRFNTYEEAQDFINKAVKMMKGKGFIVEKEDEQYVLLSRENPLIRINIYAFEIVEV